jgi:formylglycine-generating enzyme required for sulfatase activity
VTRPAPACSVIVVLGVLLIAPVAPAEIQNLAVPPQPAGGPTTGEYWALIIGIDNYHHGLPLQTAVRDALEVRDGLVHRYGVRRERLVELLNEQATRQNIAEALMRLRDEANPDDSVLIYFAGHAHYDKDGRLQWWLPVEGTPQAPETLLTDAAIQQELQGRKAKQVHLFHVTAGAVKETPLAQPNLQPERGALQQEQPQAEERAKLDAEQSQRAAKEQARLDAEQVAREKEEQARREAEEAARREAERLARDQEVRAALEAERHKVEAERQSLEEARARLEAERQELQEAQRLARKREQQANQEAEQRRFEEERKRLAKEKARQDVEGQARQEDERRAKRERLTQERGEQTQQEGEQQRLEEERKLAQERRRAEEQVKAGAEPRSKPIEEARVRPFTPLTPPPAGRELIGKDGAPMVPVSAGEFTMGGDSIDNPRHPVYLDGFYMDKHEVTTSRYARFLQATRRQLPFKWSAVSLVSHGDRPVIGVTWEDADAYCRWAGKRLPTEAEWEKAARGTDGREYPWGNEAPTSRHANFNKCCEWKGYGVLAIVGSLEAGRSPYGIYDLAGNVSEWVADWYDRASYKYELDRNPKGPADGEEKVVRGGSWYDPGPLQHSALRSRSYPSAPSTDRGFRCAKGAEK